MANRTPAALAALDVDALVGLPVARASSLVVAAGGVVVRARAVAPGGRGPSVSATRRPDRVYLAADEMGNVTGAWGPG
ncbi:hypothetical protein ABIB25_003232 [Nakamurella sp. UYEF19]|uniref:hypothetical protein n=1 Tax=Nakamurella sp. UYEF19 TaxID=1756392 RepID=UPI00339AE5D5